MAALDRYGINYLIVGGIAVGYHAEPRFTKDLDVLVLVQPNNVDRFYEALKSFGAPTHFVRAEEFLNEDFIFYMGSPPWRINLLTSLPGADFDQAYAECIKVDLGGALVDCISKSWLIKAKKASGRYQDLADIESLESSPQS